MRCQELNLNDNENVRTDSNILTAYEKDLLMHLTSKPMSIKQLRKKGMKVPSNKIYNTLTRLDGKGFLLFEGDGVPISFGLIGVAGNSIAEEIVKNWGKEKWW